MFLTALTRAGDISFMWNITPSPPVFEEEDKTKKEVKICMPEGQIGVNRPSHTSIWPNACQGFWNCNHCNVSWIFNFHEVCILVGTFVLHKYIDVTADKVLLFWRNKQLRAHSMYLVVTINQILQDNHFYSGNGWIWMQFEKFQFNRSITKWTLLSHIWSHEVCMSIKELMQTSWTQ